MTTDDYYTVKEAALKLNIHEMTLRKYWMPAGTIKYVKLSSLIRIPKSEVRRILTEKRDKIQTMIDRL